MFDDRVNRRRALATAGAWLAGAGICAEASAEALIRRSTGSRLENISDYVPPLTVAAAADLFSRMTAPVTINGVGPFPFVVDTGANQSVISAALATQLGLRLGPPAKLHGVAGVEMFPTARVDSLLLGDRTDGHVNLFVMPQTPLGAPGFLGLDRFKGRRLTLDFKGKKLTVGPSGPKRKGRKDSILTAQRRAGQLTLVDARAGDAKVTAFLDSGAQSTIGNSALKALAMQQYPRTKWTSTKIISATGATIDGEWAVLPSLKVGDMNFTYFTVVFADLHTFRLWNLSRRPAILLGVDLLSRFAAVSLDFGTDEVRFTRSELA